MKQFTDTHTSVLASYYITEMHLFCMYSETKHISLNIRLTFLCCYFRYKHGSNLVITREIHAENNQSLWTMNGRQCNQKAVEEEVKSLRIQVSNLCQFLPQVLLSVCVTDFGK